MTPPDESRGAPGWSDVDAAPDPASYVRYLDDIDRRRGRQQWNNYQLLDARAGDLILDIGCGTGSDARNLALLAGAKGMVVGTDTSLVMLHAAAARQVKRRSATCFVVADAHALPFRDSSCDGCRANRVLQHLRAPGEAIREMVRVARPGRRLVVCDPDAGMTGIEADNPRMTTAILDFRASERPSTFVGRNSGTMFYAAGLRDIQMSGSISVFRSFAAAEQTMGLRDAASRAVVQGVVAAEDARAWIANLELREREGRFFVALVLLTTVGTKPGGASTSSSPKLSSARARWHRMRFRAVQVRWMLRQRLAKRARSVAYMDAAITGVSRRTFLSRPYPARRRTYDFPCAQMQTRA